MYDRLRWVSLTHTMRCHAHYGTAGQGQVYQGRFKSFPVQEEAAEGRADTGPAFALANPSLTELVGACQ